MDYDLMKALTVILSLSIVAGGLYYILETKDTECEIDGTCECC